ncbi:MAG: exodeoxyribonuclease VII small subunit [Thermoplasmata archaeon]|nr:MAG: exodeoxyribonuclease VII small subunit [Thermoplasmata archaeon]
MHNRGEEKDMTFEEALENLERVVDELEKGELSLDDTIHKFEEGMKLLKICREKIEEAEMKIEELSGEP